MMSSRRTAPVGALLVCFAGAASASAQAPVEVEVIQHGHPTPDETPHILTVRRPNQPPPPVVVVPQPHPREIQVTTVTVETPTGPAATPPEDSDESGISSWTRAQVFLDFVSFEGMALDFADPEIDAVQSARLSPILGRRAVGGGTLSVGAELGEYVRLPELRLTVGGGVLDSGWSPLEDAGDGLRGRASSVFTVKGELVAGVHAQLGPIRPFAVLRAGYAGYFFEVDIAHPTLGVLGSETIAEGRWEVGVDTGFGLQMLDGVRGTLAYRNTFVGADAHGVSLGLELQIPD